MTKNQTAMFALALALAIGIAPACQQASQPAAQEQRSTPAAGAGSPAPATAAAPAPPPSKSATASAASKPAAAAPATPPTPQVRSLTIPAGTTIKARPTRTLSTKTLKTGDGFDAVLEEAVIAEGREIFPKGSMAMGKVVESDPGGRVKGVAHLAIALNMLHTPDGKMFDISTNTISIEADPSKAKDAAKIAVGSAVGAAIGAIAGGGKGAGIGAASGAGAGTAVVLSTRGDAAEIASETVLNFSLTAPLTLSQ